MLFVTVRFDGGWRGCAQSSRMMSPNYEAGDEALIEARSGGVL